MARFLTKLCKLVVIQCYAPTEQAITEEKDAFYETVENTLRNVKRSEIKLGSNDGPLRMDPSVIRNMSG